MGIEPIVDIVISMTYAPIGDYVGTVWVPFDEFDFHPRHHLSFNNSEALKMGTGLWF